MRLIGLGIDVSYRRAYHLQINGKDERSHRSLNADVLLQHALTNNARVERELERWRHVRNNERRHETLGMAALLTR
ncbi:integrase core domain-containing protein [Paraburkholderia sp. MMS20-SJTR3]|uniref:Integrase core domain-containing protein n=1 Tax=Paraburkholderia sejongensis TaxID=2886946 RepID=A0ABS8K5Q2_9BURK|nr:integrase core domain-containing protein [Paraburkholderia sp. MMS20-SJTR3]MCC8397477.1 integrase core domain-containing protein [Paraburkholderia sp. MMS20-SJTR3]